GSIQVEDTMTVSGDFNAAADTTITIGSGIGNGDTAFDVDTLTTGADVKIVITSDHVDGEVITLFGSNMANNLDASDLLIEDNAFFTFAVDTTGDDIIVTVSEQTTAGAASTLGVSTQDAIAVTQANVAIIADGDTTVFDNFNAAINAGGADAAKAAETVAVQADTLGAGTNVAVSTGGQVIGISSDRLGSLRTGNQFESSASTGFASGDASTKYGAWVKPFGNWAEQDNSSGVAGFEALTYGMAFGADAPIDDQYRGGVSFAYASSEIDGSGAGQSKAEIDSYQLTLYGDFTGKNYYAEASLGYAYNNNTVSRVIDFMGTDTTASGEYGSSQFIASFNAGIPMQMAGTAYFTPTAGLAWTHVISEEYTETGAGGLSQTVDIDDIDVLLGTLGAKMHTQIRYNKGYLVPNIHGGVSYDFVGDSTTATASYTGGGAAFTVEGAEVEQFGGNLGFGFTYESGNFWSIGAGYDADMKSGFISHSALFEARFKF
ncbi:MAG: autotransporter outer membrane beta-barrel domain-containing protein, partial [Sneathiella sp.]